MAAQSRFMVGYTFDPSSLTFTALNANQTANFVAASLSFSISGQVLSVGGMPFGGVSISVASGSAETDSSGNYSLSVPGFGDYTVTPYLTGYYSDGTWYGACLPTDRSLYKQAHG